MNPQEELDKYGNVIVASLDAHAVGDIIEFSLSVAKPGIIGQLVITGPSTQAEFLSRQGPGISIDPDYQFFHTGVAE